MDEDDLELNVADSIISTRQKRANAGNRLKTLLQMQEPLDGEDDIFAEVEDDQEFDIETAQTVEETVEGESENGNDDDDDEPEGGDDNFSDSSDSSIENDEEPEDAGEQALAKQQKEALKEKKKAEKRKMFEIKTRNNAPKPAKARKFVAKAESLLDSERRVSKRALAIQNKERVIERLRENERRKAEYVSPVIKKAPKLTQEQRLEEAKITEMKNTASLHHFVEVEEYRKQQQRLMWANRRPKLSKFIRYSSHSLLEYPTIIEVEVKEERPLTPDSEPEKQSESQQVNLESRAESREPESQEPESQEPESQEPESELSERFESEPPEEAPHEEPEPIEATEPETINQAEDGTAEPEANADFEIKEELPDDATLMQRAIEMERIRELEKQEEEEEKEEEEIREVEGPPTISTFNSITMHDFPDSAYNKHTVKGVYFGEQVLRSSAVPPKRICAITGNIARYLDPESGIAYYSPKTFDILNMIRNYEVAWSNELGGVYLGLRGGQRHASGVPEGFD
ncbi:hypothetical protein B9G98_00393 [Wickerhamiella sorbophila]|uniref:Vps72/YL1 C-terminal domain-containing protein n=1 Tax=Wickerhamiella sorbophila TaxID=45607 RepID=A0A2T0FCN8_9ASCO|nr:hypothetical protein B9G98_00393 [Wickerhamiella sorbophila]PRT52773.1 hypothetical protein B9G98_00393 [Wickerhamiella sorbophila]